MRSTEYLVLSIRVRSLFGIRLDSEVGVKLESLGAQGWRVSSVTPIVQKGLLGGSYTDSLFVILERQPPPRHHT